MSPWSRETLNRMTKSLDIGTFAFYSIMAGIPSGPGADLVGIALIASQKSSQVKKISVILSGV